MADQANTGIYEIVNLVNGKRYIGSAKDLVNRWSGHRKHLNRGSHHCRHLQAAWRKYGAEAFAVRTLIICAKPDLILYEQIAFDAFAPEYNSNPSAGSSLGRKLSDETKAKIAAKRLGRKMPPRGDEYRAKISAALKGKKKSPEHSAKFQEGRRLRVVTDAQRAAISAATAASYRDGKRSRARPPEYREKIAASLRGRTATPEHRANQSAAQRGTKRGPYKRKGTTKNEPCLFPPIDQGGG